MTLVRLSHPVESGGRRVAEVRVPGDERLSLHAFGDPLEVDRLVAAMAGATGLAVPAIGRLSAADFAALFALIFDGAPPAHKKGKPR